MLSKRERERDGVERGRRDEDETGEGFSGLGLSGVSWERREEV